MLFRAYRAITMGEFRLRPLADVLLDLDPLPIGTYFFADGADRQYAGQLLDLAGRLSHLPGHPLGQKGQQHQDYHPVDDVDDGGKSPNRERTQ
jgi:hypothetical protein